nr:uncharacterized protein LOC129256151 [Lytechinus pictus]
MLFALPPAIGWSRYEFVPDRAICTLKWSTNISYTVFVFSLGIFFPFIVIFVSYFRIFRTVRANFRRMRSHRGSGKVYPRSEGGAGSSRRPTDISGHMGSRGSFARSSWSNGSRRSNFNNADTLRNEFTTQHLQLPPMHSRLSRHNRVNKVTMNGRTPVMRTVSDISSEICSDGRSLFASSLARQLSLDRDVLAISPCASASTLDHHEDEEEPERGSMKSPTLEPTGRISDYLVQDPTCSTGPNTTSDLQSTEDSIRASRLYKRREIRGASGKVAIQLTSVEGPKTDPVNFETSPVGALSIALAESSRGQNILQVQAALNVDRCNGTRRDLRPIPASSQERPKTAGFYDVDKINNNNIRRLSIRSLRHSFRPSSARGRSQTLTSQNSTTASNNDELRMTLMVCAVLISFVLCWAPVTIVSFIAVLNVSIPAPVDKFAVFMMFLSSAVNPVIYGLMNRKFRLGFSRLICGWRTGKLSSNGSNRSKTRSRNKPKKNGEGLASQNMGRDPETGITTRR